MSRRETLLALAERVESASGPNYDLEHQIAHVTGYLWPDITARIPAYTASLDAAMALVPESIEGVILSFKVESFYLGNGIRHCRASVWDGLGTVSSLDTATEAASPALALTAAALRALAQTKDNL